MCGIVGDPRPPRGGAPDPRGAEAAGIPRLRQRRHRHAAGRPAGPPPRGRQADRALRPPGAGPDPRPRRHRPHPLGDARRAVDRATPTRTRRAGSRWCTTASSRTSASCAPSSRPRARSSRPTPTPRPSPSSAPRELAAGQAAGRGGARHARAAAGRLRALLPLRGRGRPADRRPPRLAAGRRLRRRRDLRRLGRAGAGAAHPPHRLSRGGRPRGADARIGRDLRRRGPARRPRDPPRAGRRTSTPRRAPTSTSWPRRCTSSRR